MTMLARLDRLPLCRPHYVLLVMGGYVLARSWSGRLRQDARATLDNTALFWHYVTVQGLAGMALVRLLPQWMG